MDAENIDIKRQNIGTEQFLIPERKIIATHFFGDGCSIDFWSCLNIDRADILLDEIKTIGFNTIIILIPWTGFQIDVEPIVYYDEYFELLEQLLEKAFNKNLQVIFRVGYAYDHGVASRLRKGNLDLFFHPAGMSAWREYLRKLWSLTKGYKNFLGGFITWEDFFLLEFTHHPLEQRVKYAHGIGYQAYLRGRLTLKEVSDIYQKHFNSFDEVPIPSLGTYSLKIFCEFWDSFLVDYLYKESVSLFPRLSMEVRVDAERISENEYASHDKTFDINEKSPVTFIYYSPAWGARNDGSAELSDSLLERMRYLLAKVRESTDNHIFVDQFNFVDNTPLFEKNTTIKAEEIPEFLNGSARILKESTIGYGLWTFKDVRINVIRNGSFERAYPAWSTEGVEIRTCSDLRRAALISRNCFLRQEIRLAGEESPKKGKCFKFEMKVRPLKQPGYLKDLSIVLLDREKKEIYQKKMLCSEDITTDWVVIREELFMDNGYTLSIHNDGDPVLITSIYAYQRVQENGIIDCEGNKKSFYETFLNMNKIILNNDESCLGN
ncbi:MAG: hypothetical protein HQL21_03320 [Candidatus Omnitrophica bacterium]|nr:hypothetical protein [Candidatus Omnitrophota bacterium]